MNQLKGLESLQDLKGIDLPFNIEEVDPICHECVRNQLKKYDKFVTKEGESCSDKFKVMCSGIPLNVIDDTLITQLTNEQIEDLEALNSPIKFAAKYLFNEKKEPFIARDYQIPMLACSSKRAVYRCSRRIGKTTAVVIRILHRVFTTKSLKVLVIGPQKKHAEDIFNRIREFIYNNPVLSGAVSKDVSSPYFCLQLKNGSEVKGFAGGTKGKGDGTAIRGSDSDLILCLPKGTLVSTSEFGLRPIETLRLSDSILGGNEKEIKVGEITNLMKRKSTLVTIPTVLGMIKCSPEHPLFNGEKDIPAKDANEVIFSLYHKELKFSSRIILARLIGFVYGDGWITKSDYGYEVGFSGQEKDLEQINEDLMLFGEKKRSIYTRYCENLERGIKGTGSTITSKHMAHSLINYCPIGKKVYQPLKVPDIIKNGHLGAKAAFLSGLFSAEATAIKFQTNNKTLRTIDLSMKSSKSEWIKNWIHDVAQLLDDLKIDYNLKFREYFDDIIKENRYTGYIIICNNAKNILNFIKKIGFCYNAEKTIASNKYKLYHHYKENWRKEYWKLNRKIRLYPNLPRDKVMKKCGVELHTVKHHRKLYDKLYSEKLLTFENYISTFIWKEGYVKLPVIKENVRFSKEEVDVYNLTSSASNRYFASGIFTHNCEEADYIDNEAIQGAIMPILYTNDHVELIGFSTPTGFKKTFYSWCTQSPQYKEFHYDYTVLPQAIVDIIEQEKGNYTEDQWIHEMLAEWGSSDAGVYKPSYVDRALHQYNYIDNKPQAAWTYAMGVDWNEKHGAEIIVLGYSPFNKKFRVVDQYHVTGSEFTQLNSVSKVIEVNEKWNPKYIYVDAGNGSSNHELLLAHAKKHSTQGTKPSAAKMLETLRKYDSGSSIEVKDSVTHKKEKKPAKPFMVFSAVRLFENFKIEISSSDQVLEKELRNYIIERYTPSGNPVFGREDSKIKDHRLDALNLACVAFQLEFNDLFKQKFSTSVGAAPDPRRIVISEDSTQSEIVERPESRDLVTIKNKLEDKVFPMAAGNTSDPLQGIKLYRHGWESDTEHIERERFLQRRISRGKISRRRGNRPKRPNI